MNYKEYRYDGRDKIVCLCKSIAAGIIISWLCYRTWYAMASVLPIYIICLKNCKREGMLRRKEILLREFKDGMQAVSSALLAGYSLENAWREAEKEIKKLYGEKSIMAMEFCQMNVEVRMNQPLEQVLEEFAFRSGCEDIESFSEVFRFAKRGGGDFAGIIRATVQKLRAKMEVEAEIATVIAGKKLEGKIMNIMPIFILAYLNLTSGEFLEKLYGNYLGTAVMTCALAAYVGAIKLSGRMMDIRV